MSDKILNLTAQNFDEACSVATERKPLLVDFWAEWCGPCKALAPVLEELAEEHEDLTVAKVDVEENADLAQRFNVRAIPTLCVFVDGKMVNHHLGVASKRQLEELLKVAR